MEQQSIPHYYFPDKFIAAKKIPEHIRLNLFGTFKSCRILGIICCFLGNQNDIIIEFGDIECRL